MRTLPPSRASARLWWVLGALVASAATHQDATAQGLPQLSPARITLPRLVAPADIIIQTPSAANVPQLQQQIATALNVQLGVRNARLAQLAADSQTVATSLAPERAKLQAALNADPRYLSLMARARAIATGPGVDKVTQLRALVRSQPSIFTDAMQRSGITRAAIAAKTPGWTLAPDLTLHRSTTVRALSSGSPSPAPVQQQTFTPPFTFRSTRTEHQGIAASDATSTSDPSQGSSASLANVIGVVGEGTAETQTGQLITLPEGVGSVTLTISCDLDYEGDALAALEMAFANVQLFVSVTSPDDPQFSQQQGLDENAAAVFAWYSGISGGQQSDITFSFDAPARRRHYLVVVDAYAGSTAFGVPSWSHAQGTGKITRIVAQYSH